MEYELYELKACERDLIVAMHEAGHAVACCWLGVPFQQVSIDRDGVGADGGGVDTESVSRPTTPADFEQYAARCRAQVIVAFAGPLAELHAARSGLIPAVGFASGRKDERDARYFIREMIEASRVISSARGSPIAAIEDLPRMLVDELGRLQREAEVLVETEFAVIEKVARRLAEAGRLTRDDVKGVVG